MCANTWMTNAIILSCEIRNNIKWEIWRKCELVGNNRLVAVSCINNLERRSRSLYFGTRVLIGGVTYVFGKI